VITTETRVALRMVPRETPCLLCLFNFSATPAIAVVSALLPDGLFSFFDQINLSTSRLRNASDAWPRYLDGLNAGRLA
jgi:hypothetical protein